MTSVWFRIVVRYSNKYMLALLAFIGGAMSVIDFWTGAVVAFIFPTIGLLASVIDYTVYLIRWNLLGPKRRKS